MELCLQWLLGRAQVNSIILGVSRLEQLEENIEAVEGELDEATHAACGEVGGADSRGRFHIATAKLPALVPGLRRCACYRPQCRQN